MASFTETDFSVELSQFLTEKNTNLEDRVGLKAYLKARPSYSKPMSYISDIEQRLELLREIRREYEKNDFELDSTAVLWSALMVAPLERLRSLQNLVLNDFSGLVGVLNSIASNMPMLLKVFLAKDPSQEELILAHVSTKRKRSSVRSQASLISDEPDLVKTGRNKSESDKCEQRDRCCVVTGAANPDICHVFPFAAKKSPDRTSSGLSVLVHLWGIQVFRQFKDMLVGDGNIIDTAPNMVALQPLLDRWWGKALIGFEPIEKIENGISLRVRWLPKTRLAMKDSITFDSNPRQCLQPNSDKDGSTKIAHSNTYRPIVDGTIINIIAHDKSAIPSWDLFSLQWDLIRMASLCGAAEASDNDNWESDDEEAPLVKVARATDDKYSDSPTTALTAPSFRPLQSLPVRSRESSPSESSQPLQSLPTVSRILTNKVVKTTPIASIAVSRIFAKARGIFAKASGTIARKSRQREEGRE